MPPDELTDEQILEEEPETSGTEATEPKEKEVQETEAATDTTEAEVEEESTEEDLTDDEETDTTATGYDRPAFHEIKAKYPDFFKTFPSMRDMFFREQRYTELFPTVEDARDAASDVEAFSTLRDSVLQGDPVPLLESIEKTDKAALTNFVTSFLPTLYKRDSNLYWQAITPVLENAAREMYRQGKSSDNEDLSNAALLFSSFLFETDEVATGKRTTVRQPVRDEALAAERTKFELDKFQHFNNRVLEDANKKLDDLISDGFDPENVFSAFLKKQCIREIKEAIGKAMESDENHMLGMRTRWERAKREGYNGDSQAKIVSAYLARAKSLLPSIRNKVRQEALGTKAKVTKTQESKVTEGRKEVLGTSGASKGSVPTPRQVDWKRTSDLDFLNDKITLRR